MRCKSVEKRNPNSAETQTQSRPGEKSLCQLLQFQNQLELEKKNSWAHVTDLMNQVTHATVHKCVML
jgi:hypothetical protein